MIRFSRNQIIGALLILLVIILIGFYKIVY